MTLDWAGVAEWITQGEKLESDVANKSPSLLAIVDRLRALMRDRLDELGLSLTDETVVMAGFFFTFQTCELLEAFRESKWLEGVDEGDRVNFVAGLAALMLNPYAPAEARR